MTFYQKSTLGGAKNFWLFSEADGYDLTHPPSPHSPPTYPRMPLKTTKERIWIDPKKTALVIIDQQNYFLAPQLHRPKNTPNMNMVDKLVQHAIPACSEAGIQVVWLNWGLTARDINEMPPSIVKGFKADTNFTTLIRGANPLGDLGSELGMLKLEDGTSIDGGGLLIWDSWNAENFEPLEQSSQGQDIIMHKTRQSGFCGETRGFYGELGIEEVLTSLGITTLLFAGANTDQCVGSSLQDAAHKGFDCLLLSDGCATSSPEFAKQSVEYNVEQGWGFVLSCEDLANGVKNTQTGPQG